MDRYEMRDYVAERLKNSSNQASEIEKILQELKSGNFTHTAFGSKYGNLEGEDIRIADHKSKYGFSGTDIRVDTDPEATAENFVQEFYDGRGVPIYWNVNEAISEAYHKAKADGSNPELVKAVEDALGSVPVSGDQSKSEGEPGKEATPKEIFDEKKSNIDTENKFTDTKELKVGDYVAVANDSGNIYEGFVTKIGPKNISVEGSSMYGISEVQFKKANVQAFYKPKGKETVEGQMRLGATFPKPHPT